MTSFSPSSERRINGERGGELGIAALALLVDMCTANNTVAIVMAGPIAKEISDDFGVTPRRSASLLGHVQLHGTGTDSLRGPASGGSQPDRPDSL